MTNHKIIVGYHIYRNSRTPVAAQISSACDRIINIMRDCGISPDKVTPCISLFIDGPRHSNINISAQTIGEIRALTSARDICIIFHAAYGDNPWSPSATENEMKRAKIIAHITHLAQICEQCGARGLVIHSSAAQLFDDHNPAMDELSRAISHATVFVETMSNDARYASPEELNLAFRATGPNIGICIDTAHIWGSGAQISSRDEMSRWLRELDPARPYAIHLNDSQLARGSHRDIHTTLGDGQIWENMADGYTSAIEWAQERSVPIILERHNEGSVAAQRAFDTAIEHDLRIIASRVT